MEMGKIIIKRHIIITIIIEIRESVCFYLCLSDVADGLRPGEEGKRDRMFPSFKADWIM